MISKITRIKKTNAIAPMTIQTHFGVAAFFFRRAGELISPDLRMPLTDDAAALPSTSSSEIGVSLCAGEGAGVSGVALRSPPGKTLEPEMPLSPPRRVIAGVAEFAAPVIVSPTSKGETATARGNSPGVRRFIAEPES